MNFRLTLLLLFCQGFECAGEIEAVGEGVTKFEVGDRVVALPEFKAWAELVAVPESFVYKIPENMTFNEAAAVTLNYLVAHILVNDLAVVRPGNTVLLHSAGGGVVSNLLKCWLKSLQILFLSCYKARKNLFALSDVLIKCLTFVTR